MKSRRFQGKNLNLFFFLFVLVNTLFAFAGPSRTTYQAKIVKPDGYPLEAASVNFKFTILDPAGSCILYSETYSAVNMNSSGGLVSFALGSGVKTFPASATTFENVFSNITPTITCDAGGPPSYSPLSTDSRKIVMQFHDGSGWQTLPAMAINAVPYAMYANEASRLNGKSDADFLQLSSLPATCGVSEAIRYNGTSFSCLAVGGASTVVTSGSVITALGYTPANGASITTVTSSIASVSSTVFSVSSTVATLSNSVSSLQTSVAASFAAMVSSQWVTSGTTISYSGGVQIGVENNSCLTDLAGTLRYNSGVVEYCNGTSWVAFGVSGAGILALNGLTSGSQTIAFGTAGNNPNVSSVGTVHTFNFPFASVGTTTAGVISNSDFSLFSTVIGKITSSAASIAQVLGYTPANTVTVTNLSSTVATSFTTLASNVAASFTTVNSAAAVSYSALSSNISNLSTSFTAQNVSVASSFTTLTSNMASSFAAITNSQWTTSGSAIHYLTGNVGVGTANPSYLLDVSGTSRHSGKALFSDGAFNNPGISFANNPSTGFYNNGGHLGFSVNGGLKATLYPSSLAFNAGGAGPQIYFTGGDAANPSYAFNSDSDTGMFNPNSSGGSNELAFSTSGVERVRIASGGQVGIGVSDPTVKLQVASTANLISAFQNVSGTETTSLNVFAYPSDYSMAYLQDTAMIYTGGDARNLQLSAANAAGVMKFTVGSYQASAEKMRITTSGTGIGVTDPSAYLHIRAGTSAFAPLKLTSGALMTSAQSGTIEYDGFNYYLTDGTNTRRAIATATQAGTLDSVNTISSSGNVTLVPTGSVVVSSTTASTNSQTGALVVKGGLGVAGNIYSSGTIQAVEIAATSSTITPYLYGSTVSGGSLRIDSTTHASKGNILMAQSGGRVGIGLASPNAVLDVSGSTVIRAIGPGAGIWSLSNSVTAGRGGLIHTQLAPEVATSGTSGYKEYTTSTGANNGIYRLAFIPDLSNPDSVVDRMIVTAAGNFGLGVSPGSRLHVSGSIQTNSVADSVYANNFTIFSSAADMTMNYSSGDLHFNSDTVSAVTIKRSGYVGIGTSEPLVKLTVDDTAGAVSSTYVPATDKLVVMSNGNGVINITTPNTAAGAIYFSDPQSRDAGGVAYSHLTDTMTFRVNNSNLMSFNASGALTVGTGASAQKLTVRGASVAGSASQTNISAFVNGGINLAGSISNISQEAITYQSGGGGGAAIAFRRGGSFETYMDFYTNNVSSGGAIKKQMTLSNLGYFGIGTDTPIYKFEVNDAGGYLRSETNDGGLELGSSNDDSSYLDFHGLNNLATDYTGRIEYKDSYGFGFSAGGLAAPALTIVSATGHVGIGLGYASNYAELYVNSNTPSGYTRIVNANAAAGGNQWTWYSSSTGAPLGANRMCFGLGACLLTIVSNGDGILSGVFSHASDVRLKRDIAAIPYALDAISQIDGVTYYWIDSNKSQKRQVGLIAQQVEKVFPELVATDEKGFKSVAYQNLVAPIINAIKEIREWMFKTDERVLMLEKENAELKQRLENLEKAVNQKK